MAFDPGAVCRAFSQHRYDEALGHLAGNVKWTIVGYMVLEGADAVTRTCRETQESLAGASVELDRCVTVTGADSVAVDMVVRYVNEDGVTAVATCGIYEFRDDQIVEITSYAVQISPGDAGAQPPPLGSM
ncbi:nuclear transport factor 2 family protein [Mycobacterium sp. Y57]|uniref:nuclear transport factor 2 family protein n=1 Tax=Mycolicibacterium xanthum TaxID=2796469 RepID=UPI001C85BFD2|nr:nuclear transport factor 2 family protein [Mycolicibacterium xanthum]MBX7431499.1 nuclear transport factor 2 family protein [Mycolicibacterium xanthum]